MRLVDRPVPADRLAIAVELLDYIIAIGVASTGFAGLDSATLATASLVGEILEEQRIHRALQSDMQMRHLAFGQCEDLHVRIGHAFEETGNVLLITREPVHRLSEDQVEASARGVGDQCLDAGAQEEAPETA